MITLIDSNNCLQFSSWKQALKQLHCFRTGVITVYLGKQKYQVAKDVLVNISNTLSAGKEMFIQYGGECHYLISYDDINQLFFNFPMHKAHTTAGDRITVIG